MRHVNNEAFVSETFSESDVELSSPARTVREQLKGSISSVCIICEVPFQSLHNAVGQFRNRFAKVCML